MKKIAIIMALGLATSLQSYAKGPSNSSNSFGTPKTDRPDTNKVEKVEVQPDMVVKTYVSKGRTYRTTNELRSIVLTKNAEQVKIQVCDEYNKESQAGVNCEVIGEGQWNSKEIDQLVNAGTVKENWLTVLPSSLISGTLFVAGSILALPFSLGDEKDEEVRCFHLGLYTGDESKKRDFVTPSDFIRASDNPDAYMSGGLGAEIREALSDMNQDMSQAQSGTYVYSFEEENFSNSKNISEARVFGEALGFVSSTSLNKLVCTY